MHGVLNIDEKKLIAQFGWKSRDECFKTKGLFGFHKLGDLLSQVTENQWLISHACLVVDDL